MAKDAEISVAFRVTDDPNGLRKIVFEADGLRKLMTENVKIAQELQKQIFNFAAFCTGFNAVKDAAAQLSSTLHSLTDESLAFDKSMRAANTMAGKSSAEFRELKGEVADLAKQIPIARDQLANGLYQTISNGVPEDNWIEFLNASARSAVGGLADINKVVGVTSTLIKNYGLEWSAAADIQDKIQLTAKNGVTSFEQLAQALPRVTGNAATLGVSIDELMGTFATLTGVSGNTAEVSTQLAAIFTALVKPSSEAAEMAAKMGIQFDAAAIKAAGGFQNFLTQLDSSVKAYAQSAGVLEQEVYSKLFGSAESIRALIPLQGELADKFSENVANMVNSAGTMDAAFEEMNDTSEATTQRLRNLWASFTDLIARVTSGIQPFIDFGASLLSSAANVAILINAYKGLNIQQALTAAKSKLMNAMLALIGLTSKKTRLGLEMLAVSAGKAAVRAEVLKIALRGLIIASGVGVAIWAVTAIIEHFANASDEAAESTEKLDDATGDYIQAAADAKVQIENDTKALGDLIKAKKDTTEAVKHLNDTYGDLFGSFKTAEEAYKILTERSQLYAKQLGYEAQTKALTSKIAEAAIKREVAAKRKQDLEDSGKAKVPVNRVTPGQLSLGAGKEVVDYETPEYKQVKKEIADAEATEAELTNQLKTITELSERNRKSLTAGLSSNTNAVKVNEMTWQQCADAIEANDKALKNTTDSKRISALKAQNAQILKRKKLMESKTGIGSARSEKKKKLVADPKTAEDLQNNIRILSNKFTGEDTPEQRKIVKDITLYEKKLKAIELTQLAAERPVELETLEDISKELRYQNALREIAAADQIAGIDAEIKRLNDLKSLREYAGHTTVPVDKISTYSQLNDEVSYYDWLLQNGTEQERIFAQKNLNDLERLRKSWDEMLADLKKPGDISTLDTIEKLDAAIGYVDRKIKTASDDERAALQRTKMAYEDKRKSLQRAVEIPTMLHEADEINKLTGKEYKLKISGMGFDELTAKIAELNRMLNDKDHPLTAEQRKDIESLIDVYKKWRKEGIDVFGTLRSGWDSVKGISGSVESLTEALSSNGDAWKTITGIVDGFIQIYEGIKSIVGVISELSGATNVLTAAKKSESAATVESTAQTVANTEASLVNTSAKSGESIANATASGAKMPFPMNLVAIAAGVAAVVGALAAIGSFATGGIVGGNSKTGDKLLARVNSGEMILNSTQQSNLFRMINTPTGIEMPRYDAGSINANTGLIQSIAVEPVIIGGTLRASARDLICVLANETRISSKSGKKTNIII